ncbi:MAG: cell wall biogenesis protein [Rhodospirillaceae bacterium]|jgi:dTDP-4-amino-4,6-dideoxygalactose transaminase|uniref:DegT/DnrJ/EryC1/StrS family aminotransferase n=1 Tax=Hwanghaeella sp. 1Z406 TaxID=3402811 RepID=UPI000C5D2D80|nr:cell wall biogenesis protein [Rhodospirillaceae bacterium]|tara:strand:- start:39448 stop:40599 length:1152 start_codon:yes stop_codon:yes gene_type:complete
MPDTPIPFGKPQLDTDVFDAVRTVLESGMLVHGTVTPAFEAAFAQRIGAAEAVAVSSCTAGLHLTLFTRNIGPGDRVAVPAMTHVATAHSVELVGAEPVFIDVDPATGNMDPAALEAGEGPLAVIMPVHYLGLPCDMDRILAVAQKKGAFVLEDCALAVDATWGDQKAGTLGLAGSFSFYPVKHMTSIEGGMVTTNDPALAHELRRRRAFGYNRALGERTRPGLYDVDILGMNYRMSEVEAAVGLAQLTHLDDFMADRSRNDAALRAILTRIDGLTLFPDTHGKATSSHYCINAVLPRDGSVSRDRVVDGLNARKIGSSVHYPGPVPLFTYYSQKYGYKAGQFPVAEWLADQTISLPVGPHLTRGDAERVGNAFQEAYSEASR